ncbi:flagellar hook-length control protein FliK [Janthinobacterium sp. PC23-8]|uniref:flagellar hook-length control protein FliK n=1 Tax=Janthinobacterium sp. PC23-8 TaxID=2012679 RepID=UPI0015953BF3|nr:flagellar hook-length control protein FliK [Janthinobacterium sp. PC23-8]
MSAITSPVTPAPSTNAPPAPRVAMAGAPDDLTAPATVRLTVRPATMQFNAQLGALVPIPQPGEPLTAAMPAPAAATNTVAPALAAAFIPTIGMPAAVAAYAPGVKPAANVPGDTGTVAVTSAPATPAMAPVTPGMAAAMPAMAPVLPGAAPARAATPDGKATTSEPATTTTTVTGLPVAAVAPGVPATPAAASDSAVDVRPAVRQQAGLPDAPGTPLKSTTPGAPVTIAGNVGGLDAERNGAASNPAAAPAANLGLTAAATAGTLPAQGGDIIKLNGTAQQWQEPLREALGERLQTQISRNSEYAVIRLDPPMLGRIDIAIRHTAGSLQVNLSASNTEVLRQLQSIGENMRNDLAQRQYTEVAVTISATPRSPAAQAFAEGDARGQRQPARQQDDAEPGRALSDDTPAGTPYGTTFAMHEREYN